MKYIITVTETLSREIEIEAPDYETAREIVEQKYRDEEIVLHGDDWADTRIA